MRTNKTNRARPDAEAIARAIGERPQTWAKRCHQVSLAIVRSGLFAQARVARGFCRGVVSQHSWVVLGDDCYDPDTVILDVTLWSYRPEVPNVWYGDLRVGWHHPHGEGWIDPATLPERTRDRITLRGLSTEAREFLRELAPDGLDAGRWHWLASRAAVRGWPAGEVYTAMYKSPRLQALLPIDRVGMLTDLNPGRLYR